MLAGLEQPTKGEIVIAGKHIEKLIEFIGLDIFNETELQYIYDKANKRNITALMAYAMDAMKRCRDKNHKNDLKI